MGRIRFIEVTFKIDKKVYYFDTILYSYIRVRYIGRGYIIMLKLKSHNSHHLQLQKS